MTRFGILLLAAALVSPVDTSAQTDSSVTEEEIVVTPSDAFLEDGYVELELAERRGTDERKMVDRVIAGPLAASLGEKDYGFDYVLTDLDGDGLNDVVLSLRVAVTPAFGTGAGAPTYAYLFRDGGWKLLAKERAFRLGMRETSDAGRSLAFANEGGYVAYEADGDDQRRTEVTGRPSRM